MDYYLGINNEQKGPYTWQQISAMKAAGEINPDTLYCTEGMAEWKRLEELVEESDASKSPPLPKSPPIPPTQELKPATPPLAIVVGRWLGLRWGSLRPLLIIAKDWTSKRSREFIKSISRPLPGISIEERLMHLEHQNIALKWIGLSAFMFMCVLFLGNWRSSSSGGGTFEALTIRDSEGKIRYHLGTTSEGEVAQRFYDKNGTERIMTRVRSDNNCGQRFCDANGKVRVIAYASTNGSAGMTINDGEEHERLALVNDNDGTTSQVFFDAKGTRRVMAYSSSLSDSGVALFDPNGVLRQLNYTDPASRSALTLYDVNKRERYELFTDRDGNVAQTFDAPNGITKVVTLVHRSGDFQIPVPEESIMDHFFKWGGRALTLYQFGEEVKKARASARSQ